MTREKLRWLRLPGMAEQLSPLLDKAGSENLTVLDVVDRLCDGEKASRLRNAIGPRIRDARFPAPDRALRALRL